MVSMTWPEYLAGCCRIDGRLTRLRLQEADVVLALLLGHPDRWNPIAELIETVWPEANPRAEQMKKAIYSTVCRLRRKRMKIQSVQGWGYRIPREARGRPERTQLAA